MNIQRLALLVPLLAGVFCAAGCSETNLPIEALPRKKAESGFRPDFNMLLQDDKGNLYVKLFQINPKQSNLVASVEAVECPKEALQNYPGYKPACERVTYKKGQKAVLSRINGQLADRIEYGADGKIISWKTYDVSGNGVIDYYAASAAQKKPAHYCADYKQECVYRYIVPSE